MEGPSVEDEENRGMIARAVLQIFNNTQDLEEKGWQVYRLWLVHLHMGESRRIDKMCI